MKIRTILGRIVNNVFKVPGTILECIDNSDIHEGLSPLEIGKQYVVDGSRYNTLSLCGMRSKDIHYHYSRFKMIKSCTQE